MFLLHNIRIHLINKHQLHLNAERLFKGIIHPKMKMFYQRTVFVHTMKVNNQKQNWIVFHCMNNDISSKYNFLCFTEESRAGLGTHDIMVTEF